jgi:hypothetical protein
VLQSNSFPLPEHAITPCLRADKISRPSGQPFIPRLKSLGFSGSFDKCTENPEGVGERWGDITEVNGGGYIEKPLIRFEDINGSGNKDLAVQEVEHNGTCSTADVYLYYLIGKDLSLTTDLAIQTHADVCNENDSQINRAIQVKKKNYLQIGVLKYNTVTGINKNLGYFEVVKKDPNQPYQMLKVTPTADYSNSPWFLLSIMASETGTDLNRLVTVGY